MNRHRVLVTDAERASALAVIRSLGRAGHTVIAASTKANAPGFSSCYASASARYPSPFTHGARATAEAVAALARRHRVDVVVPVTDDVLVPLTHHRPNLPEGCALATASDAALHQVTSKIATVELARRVGVRTPECVVLRRPDDATGVVERLGAPVVVKPDRSRVVGPDDRLRKGSVSYAWSDDDVRAALAAAGQPVMAQRYHAGEGHGIGMVLHDGRPLVAVAHRRLHEVPVSGGASSRRESVEPDPGLLRDACALLGTLAWTGAAMVEFKVSRSGASLMEVNGRLWGSVPLAERAGADVAGTLLGVHLGDPEVCRRDLDLGYRRGVRARNLDLELVWIGSVLVRGGSKAPFVPVSRRDGLRAVVDLVRPDQGDDLAAADDRRPVITGVRNALGRAVRKVGPRG